MEHYTSVAVAALSGIPRPAKTVSPAYSVIDDAAHVDPRLPRREWCSRMRAIYANAPPAAQDRTTPFTAAEIDLLRELYLADQAAIAAMEGVTLLRF